MRHAAIAAFVAVAAGASSAAACSMGGLATMAGGQSIILPEDCVTVGEYLAMAEREARCIAEAVYFEGRSEPLHGQRLIVDTLFNRVSRPRFRVRSFCAAWRAPSQFEGYALVKAGARMADARAAARAEALAREAVSGNWIVNSPSDLFWGATQAQPNACERLPGWADPNHMTILGCTGPRGHRYAIEK